MRGAKNILKANRGAEAPISKTIATLDAEVDIIQRRLGTQGNSATTVDDLKALGVLTQSSDGSTRASTLKVGGAQATNDFLKQF